MSLRSKKRKPTHPGAILRNDVLPSLNLTQAKLAEKLHVSRRTISEILNEHRPITTDVAIRLSYFLDTTPESWLNMQQAYDIWELNFKNASIYREIKKAA